MNLWLTVKEISLISSQISSPQSPYHLWWRLSIWSNVDNEEAQPKVWQMKPFRQHNPYKKLCSCQTESAHVIDFLLSTIWLAEI
jgi:hypothetical protein